MWEATVKAYEASKLNNAAYGIRREMYGRSHILGGIIPGLQQFGNVVVRYPKMAFAALTGLHEEPAKVEMPEPPESLKGSKLEEGLREDWELKQELAKYDTKSVDHFLHFRFNDAWAAAHEGDFARKRESHVLPATSAIAGLTGIAAFAGSVMRVVNNARAEESAETGAEPSNTQETENVSDTVMGSVMGRLRESDDFRAVEGAVRSFTSSPTGVPVDKTPGNLTPPVSPTPEGGVDSPSSVDF